MIKLKTNCSYIHSSEAYEMLVELFLATNPYERDIKNLADKSYGNDKIFFKYLYDTFKSEGFWEDENDS